jgi:circadian clock protein KaiC
MNKAASFEQDLATPLASGSVVVSRTLPVDLEVDAVLSRLSALLVQTGAVRIVIDSISELERSVPAERLRGVFAALSETLRGLGVTSLFIREARQAVGPELDFADSPLEQLAENVVLLRVVERRGKQESLLSILKMRESDHDRSARAYQLTRNGLQVRFAEEPTRLSAHGATRSGTSERKQPA